MKLGYDEISPITGEKCVMKESLNGKIEDDEAVYARICFQSGYNNITSHTENNPALEEIEEKLPDVIRDSKYVDEFGFCWYLSAMNLGVVMLYPEPINEIPTGYYSIAFRWVVMPISLNESDVSFRLDEENACYFNCTEFEDAFDKLQEIAQCHYTNAEL